MGHVVFGAPVNEVEWLKDALGCDVFIESGTFKGDTARRMASLFKTVVTIERDAQLHSEARERHPISNITFISGDSRDELARVLPKDVNCLVWLDAHWSGHGTYGEGDECPLLAELQVIFDSTKTATVLIDDARLFLAPPPPPHHAAAWPSIDQVVRAIPDDYRIIVRDDVIYVLKTDTFFQFQDKIRNGECAQ
ncbi:MAG: hypothetical protein AAGH48_01330 [Pseudomonadota bacterium]